MKRLVLLASALGLVSILGACAGDTKPLIPGAPVSSIPHRAGGPIAAAAPTTAPVNPQSLYARLGQRAGIEAVMTDFVGRMAKDRRVNSGFANTDAKAFIGKLTDQLCQASGGPCRYTGKDMKTAHAGQNITNTQWNITVAHLQAAMRAKRVGRKEQQEVLAALGPMKSDIVGQ
jgi:hemoglobin